MTATEVPTQTIPARAALIAGLSLLVMAVVAAWANFAVIEGLTTPGDAAQTAQDVAASKGAFQLGIAAFALVTILDVVVAWALYQVFRAVHQGVSASAGVIRAVYAVVLGVATASLFGALDPAADADVLDSIEQFQDIFSAGLGLFGLHLLLLGWLMWQMDRIPRIIGVLLAIAGLGYLIDTLGTWLIDDYSLNVALFTFIGEVVLMVWLFIKARSANA